MHNPSSSRSFAPVRVRSRVLARLVHGYSIATFPMTGKDALPAFLCGSEGDDALLLFDPPDFRPRFVAREPGGFISTAPLLIGGRRHVIATTLFKPGFNGLDAAIRLYPLDGGERGPSSLVTEMPFTHRIAALNHANRDFCLISTLCSGKSEREDWSQPGGIHLAEAPADPAAAWPTRQIITGLRKNHGMDFARLGRTGRPGYLLSSMDGLVFMPLPSDPDGPWSTEVIHPEEHSDAFAFDWDGDGIPEVFSIAPFHGNELAIHRETTAGWERQIIHDDLAMGHIVWAGNLLGGPCLLAGSRREQRELRLYRPTPDGGIDLDYQVIDKEIGPTQIAVIPRGARAAVLYVAAHGLDEVRLYELEV